MLDVAVAQSAAWPRDVDWDALAQQAVSHALATTALMRLESMAAPVEVAITLSNDAEIRLLNAEWRDKDKATNVLSFPQMEPDDLDALTGEEPQEILLGDIILALETCAREAEEKAIPLTTHATHLVVHGMLHLLGYDHIDEAEAQTMEDMERAAMAAMGHADPYRDTGE